MKIYTKTGDSGTTSTLSGKRLPKHHIRIESYGTVDELNSHLGWLRDQEMNDKFKKDIISIQNILFSIGSNLASDKENSKIKLPQLVETDIEFLEKEIDQMNELLPEMRNFILPGGHVSVSACHICRSICRRTERLVSHLSEGEQINPLIIKYLNRLSDYLFVLSRKLSSDLGAEEIPWKS